MRKRFSEILGKELRLFYENHEYNLKHFGKNFLVQCSLPSPSSISRKYPTHESISLRFGLCWILELSVQPAGNSHQLPSLYSNIPLSPNRIKIDSHAGYLVFMLEVERRECRIASKSHRCRVVCGWPQSYSYLTTTLVPGESTTKNNLVWWEVLCHSIWCFLVGNVLTREMAHFKKKFS